MSSATPTNPEPKDVLFRIKRGLAGYISYLAACDMNQAFSEYVLYEPILRILTARGFSVDCEYECPGIKHPTQGDRKRIDFRATGHDLELAIEVKWAKSEKPNIKRDVEKLQAFIATRPQALALLCVFGRKTYLEVIELQGGAFKERGTALYADLKKTRYGCRIFQLKMVQS
jgi:Holliday junction resolvase